MKNSSPASSSSSATLFAKIHRFKGDDHDKKESHDDIMFHLCCAQPFRTKIEVCQDVDPNEGSREVQRLKSNTQLM